MLIIRNANSAQFFIGTTRSSMIDETTGLNVYCSALIGPFGPSSGSSYEFKGRIKNGSANRFGERGCSHYQWEGDLTIFSGILKVVDATSITGHYYRPVGTSVKYGYLLPPHGQLLTPPWKFNKGKTYQYRVDCSAERIIYSTYREGITTTVTSETPIDGFYAFRRGYRYVTTYEDFLVTDFLVTSGTIRYWQPFPVSGAPVTRDDLFGRLEYLRRTVASPALRGQAAEPYQWGKIAQKAVETISFADTNGLQYFPELLTLKTMCKQFLDVDVRSPKALAGAYLAWKYGVESSFRDTKLYGSGVSRFLASRFGKKLPWNAVRAADHSYVSLSVGDLDIERHYKIFYRHYDDAILNGYRFLREWGLAPTVTAAWDLVPFSFCLDWFVNVGSFFEQIDARPMMAMYKVLGVTKSEKFQLRLSPEWLSGSMLAVGDFAYTTYERSTQRKADEPHFAYETPQNFDNYVEAAALIVQRKSR